MYIMHMYIYIRRPWYSGRACWRALTPPTPSVHLCQQIIKVSKYQSIKLSKYKSIKVAMYLSKYQSYVTRASKYQNIKVSKYQNQKYQSIRVSKYPSIIVLKYQSIKCSKYQRIKMSKFQSIRVARYQRRKVSKYQSIWPWGPDHNLKSREGQKQISLASQKSVKKKHRQKTNKSVLVWPSLTPYRIPDIPGSRAPRSNTRSG